MDCLLCSNPEKDSIIPLTICGTSNDAEMNRAHGIRDVYNSSPWRNRLARLTVMQQVHQEVGSSSLPGDGERIFQLLFLLLVDFYFLIGQSTGEVLVDVSVWPQPGLQ